MQRAAEAGIITRGQKGKTDNLTSQEQSDKEIVWEKSFLRVFRRPGKKIYFSKCGCFSWLKYQMIKSDHCYAAMCPAGLQGDVRSRQVHQLTLGTDVGCGLPNAI